jgi:hypothetical protein
MRGTRLTAMAALAAAIVVAVGALLQVPAAADGVPDGALQLAVEAPDDDQPPPGPDPRPDSPFGPPEFDVPWTYGMGIALTVVAVLAIAGTAFGYWLLVVRPERETPEAERRT